MTKTRWQQFQERISRLPGDPRIYEGERQARFDEMAHDEFVAHLQTGGYPTFDQPLYLEVEHRERRFNSIGEWDEN